MFSLLACPNCSTTNPLKLLDIKDKKKGLVRFIQIKCRNSEFKHSYYNSPRIDSTKDNCSRGVKTTEINIRAVYGFLSIGVGHIPLTKLCGFLNMPPPLTKNVYDGLSYSIKVASKQIAEKNMSDAAARLRGTEKTTDVGISVDDTWQRKSFSSTYGVVIAISIYGGKILDVIILSKICKDCTSMKKLPLLIPLVMRHGSYLIILILFTPALPLEWKQQELLISLVHQKRSMEYITPLFMEMVIARLILLSKMYMVQLNLFRSLNMSVTIKDVSVRGVVI